MSSNHEDVTAQEIDEAQLTAHALGQLSGDERAAAEAILARVEAARQSVEETVALAAHVRQAYEQAPAPQAAASLREAIQKELSPTIKIEAEPLAADLLRLGKPSWLRRHWAAVAAMAAGILVMVGLLMPAQQRARESARRVYPPAVVSQSEMARSDSASVDGKHTLDLADIVAGGESGSVYVTRESSSPARFTRRMLNKPTDKQYIEQAIEAQSRLYLEESLEESIGGYRSESGYRRGHGYSRRPTAPDTEQYDQIVDNEFRPVERQPLSTFAIDVDTASYANVRRFLNEGRLPPPDAVRIEEMINYFPYDYSPPSGGTPFAVNMEVAGCPWQPEHRLLRVGIKGREIERQSRGPSNIVFLLDVSGSMGEPDKLPLVKQAMRMLVEQLTEDDRVAIVTYASGTDVRLPSARGDEQRRILDAIESLQAGGCTYGSAGIELAYQQAAEHFVPKGVNRIILCTDGDLNVGITEDNALVRLIQEKAKSGVFLTVLGFGTGNLKDSKMEKLADKGHGVYAYIDGLREAHRVLVEQLTGHLVTIAKDLKIQIEFNPAEVTGYRLIGYENRVMANRDFDNDRKLGGDIGAGHTVTALYELVPANSREPTNSRELTAPGKATKNQPLKYQRVPREDLTEQARSGELLTLRLRYKEPERNESRLLEFTAKDAGTAFGRASADFRFASAVAAFGMVLRGSPHRGDATLPAVEEYAATALGKDPNGHRAEFLDLVRKARSLAPGL
jgi:Ca-activated chloride channel homolog